MGVQDFRLILVNSFVGSTAVGLPLTAAVDLNTARGFASCSISAYEEDTESTRVLEVSMAIEARGLFNPSIRDQTIGSVLATPPIGFANYFEGNIPISIPTVLAVN
jgi:hypothetical protein